MGGARRARHRRARGARAQTTVEFALVAPLFFLCFFAAIDAGLWAIQTSAAVSAADQAARVAAAAAGTPQSQDTPSSSVLLGSVRTQLQAALFGTRVTTWCQSCSATAAAPGPPAPGCPASPDEVERGLGSRTVVVCVETHPAAAACPPPPAPPVPRCGDPPTVTVHVIGFLASLVPPLSGFGWHAGEIPVDVVATTHTLRFAP